MTDPVVEPSWVTSTGRVLPLKDMPTEQLHSFLFILQSRLREARETGEVVPLGAVKQGPATEEVVEALNTMRAAMRAEIARRRRDMH